MTNSKGSPTSDSVESQYIRLTKILGPRRVNRSDVELKYLFGKIVLLNYLLFRVETRRSLKDSNLDACLSFLIEAYISFYHSELNASKLLLRASIDSMVKYMKSHFSEPYDEHRFSPNLNNYRQSNAFKIIESNHLIDPEVIVGDFTTAYDQFSKLTHNIIQTNDYIAKYFSTVLAPKQKEVSHYFNLIDRVVKDFCLILLSFSKQSLVLWENEDRLNLLALGFNNKTSKKLNQLLRTNSSTSSSVEE